MSKFLTAIKKANAEAPKNPRQQFNWEARGLIDDIRWKDIRKHDMIAMLEQAVNEIWAD